MGAACCSCLEVAEDSVPRPEEPSIVDSPTSMAPYRAHAQCTCLSMGLQGNVNLCPVSDRCQHHCRCIFLRSAPPTTEQPICLSINHKCLCMLTDRPSIICRRHMVPVSISAEYGFSSLTQPMPSTCSICLCMLQCVVTSAYLRSVIRLRVCGHYYHPACLKAWFAKGRFYCPLCMRRVAEKPAPDVRVPWTEACPYPSRDGW